MPAEARVIRKVRNDHGTRVARRIVCTNCGQSDTIDFAPKDPANVLCRKCAFDRFGAIDPDDRSVRTRSVTCAQCSRSFEAVIDPRNIDAPVCPDCLAGIETKQQDRARSATRLSARVVRSRRAPAKTED